MALKPVEFYTVYNAHLCDNYVVTLTCYSAKSEPIYTYQNEMEDLQMGRDWTKEELNAASEMMKQSGHMGFEEFCQAIEQKQPIIFDLRERDRKELVKDISEILGEKAEYMRMPTCAYRIGSYTIARDGTLTWGSDVTDAERLLQALTARGWNYAIVIDTAAPEEPQPAITAKSDTGAYDFCIELPEETLLDAARANLDRIIESKGALL